MTETELQELIATAKAEQWRVLDLSDTGLKTFPMEIANLTSLEYLDLNSNQITVIPEAIANLTSLQFLSLDSNQITVIPEAIANLTNLRHLYLKSNQITVIPEAIANLTSLQYFNLNGNQITVIPEAIANLTDLKRLYLNRNQITLIPAAIANLTKLKILVLDNNPIINVLPEIIRQGWGKERGDDGNPQVIFDYLIEQSAGGLPLHETKLIFVGFGEVGKTSLVKRLVKNDFDPREPQTHEVQITKWDVTLNTQAAEKILVHTWDFGGQQIMHSTHQFFLTERSLYVLVLNGRQGHEDEDAEYWLEMIGLLSKHSPVIIALNKYDSTPFRVNRSDLREKFPNIVSDGFILTDCKNRTGIDRLRQIIIRELDQLEGLRDSFPKKWFSIKDRLAAMTENYIDFETYRQICRDHGEVNPDKQEKLAYYLNLLGIALNYSDDDRLKDTNILNPHWVTKGVYRIITSDLLNQGLGRLDRSKLARILDLQEYPRSCYDFLLSLMRKFELCFPFPEANDAYLVPNLLDKQQPEITTQFEPSYCLNFRYGYPVLPEGLLPRFIVRTHEMNKTKDWWRSGTVLEFEGSHALIKADRVKKSVSILIRDGNNDSQRRLLAIIRSNFEAIHSNFKFMVTELVPIPEHPQKCHSYQELLAFEQHGILNVHDFINGKIVQTSVKELLNGIKSPEQRRFDREHYLSINKDDIADEDRSDKMRDRDSPSEISEKRRDKSTSNINVFVTVPINNNNQQDQAMDISKGNSQFTNNQQGANIGNSANQVNDNAQQKAIQHNYAAEPQSLAESAKEIQDLIEQLARTYPTDTRAAKNGFADEIVKQIEANPAITNRLLSATKAGGVAAIEQFLSHPAVSFVVAAIEDWEKTKTPK